MAFVTEANRRTRLEELPRMTWAKRFMSKTALATDDLVDLLAELAQLRALTLRSDAVACFCPCALLCWHVRVGRASGGGERKDGRKKMNKIIIVNVQDHRLRRSPLA